MHKEWGCGIISLISLSSYMYTTAAMILPQLPIRIHKLNVEDLRVNTTSILLVLLVVMVPLMSRLEVTVA